VARSHVHERVHRPTAPRRHYRKAVDEKLLPLIRRVVAERPSYGYRRVTALVNRLLVAERKATANHKRVFQSKRQGLRSNLRWCSDLFEITCWDGDIVRIVFVIDAHDREVLAWHAAAGTGISGSMVRDLMLEAVEIRFDHTPSSGCPTTAVPLPLERHSTSPQLSALPRCRARSGTALPKPSSKRCQALALKGAAHPHDASWEDRNFQSMRWATL
jgi:transposase InsO family protein